MSLLVVCCSSSVLQAPSSCSLPCSSPTIPLVIHKPPLLGNAFCIAPPALPPFFKEEMHSKDAREGDTAMLRCELSTAAAPVQWMKGHQVLQPGSKYTMRQEGCISELVVHDIHLKDAGDYTCVCGDQKTTAALTVHGKMTVYQELPVCLCLLLDL